MNFDYDPSVFLQLTKEEAVDWVMDEYGGELKSLIFTYVKSEQLTDYLFKEVMYKIYHQFDQFKASYAVKPWIFKIAVKTCKRYMKSPLNTKSLRKNSIDFHAQLSVLEVKLIEDFFQLPTEDRVILVLHDLHAFSIKEISYILKLKKSTVHNRLERVQETISQDLSSEKEAVIKIVSQTPLYDDKDKVKVYERFQREHVTNVKPIVATLLTLSSIIVIGTLFFTNADRLSDLTGGNNVVQPEESEEEQSEQEREEDQREIEEEPEIEEEVEVVGEEQFIWEEVSSREEVDAFYFEMVPRLEEAEAYGLVTEVNETANIINSDVNIHIEKMWHTSHGIYFFYSIEKDDGIDINDFLLFNLGTEHWDHEYNLFADPVENRGLIFDDRYYQVSKTIPLEYYTHEEILEFDEDLISIEVLFFLNGMESKSEKIEVLHSYQRNLEDQHSYSIPVNEQFTKNGITIIVDRLEVGLAGYKMYYDIINSHGENHQLEYIYGAIETDTGEERTVAFDHWGMRTSNEEYVFIFDWFRTDVKEFDVIFNAGSFISDASIDFSFDVSQYDADFYKLDQPIEQPVDIVHELMYTEIAVDYYIVDEQGMTILFSFDQPNDEIQLHTYMHLGPGYDGMMNFPNVLNVTNEEGEQVNTVSYNQLNLGRENFTIDKYFLIRAEKINVSWTNLAYAVQLDEKITIELE